MGRFDDKSRLLRIIFIAQSAVLRRFFDIKWRVWRKNLKMYCKRARCVLIYLMIMILL